MPDSAAQQPVNRTDRPSSPSVITTLLREPTLHFVIVAGLIFAAYGLFQSHNANVLEIDQREIDARIFIQEMTTGESLTQEQTEFVTASYIEEQILVNEALTMGLDNDARINELLAQKMRHVLSGSIIQPSESELNEYYELNRERYRTQPAVTVEELVFNSREPLPEQMQASLTAGAASADLLQLQAGSSSELPNVNHLDLSNIFAPEFADQVFAARIGQWNGPFVSNRGQHWLRVSARTESSLPPLEAIADQVRLNWIAEEEDARLQQEIDKLWDRYTIVIKNAQN
jgi:peptidyl-prolyl cis-trans isomerase C